MLTDPDIAHFVSFILHFIVNLVALTIVAYFIHFRRHSRRDLLMAFATFNIGLFLVMTVISLNGAALGVGFGLFAVLSIIRIRSEEFSNTELAYAFAVLVIGLVNAFGVGEQSPTPVEGVFTFLLNALAILVVYILDHPRFLRRVGRQQITLDTIHPDDQSLRADLEKRMNARVLDYAIDKVDYVREITVLNVRYTANS